MTTAFSLAFRILGCSLFAGLAVYSFSLAQSDASAADLQFVARRIEQKGAVSPQTIKDLAAGAASDVALSTCRSGILLSATTIQLANLELQDELSDFDNWNRSVSTAEDVIGHAVRCMPGDGNLWARYAMVKKSIAEQANVLASILDLSGRRAPADIGPLTARLNLLTTVAHPTLAASKPRLETDLSVFLRRARDFDIYQLLNEAPARMTAYIPAAMADFSEERRRRIVQLVPSTAQSLVTADEAQAEDGEAE